MITTEHAAIVGALSTAALIAILAFWLGVASTHAVADGEREANRAAYNARHEMQEQAVSLGYAYWVRPADGWHGNADFRWGKAPATPLPEATP